MSERDWIREMRAQNERREAARARLDAFGLWSPPGWTEWPAWEVLRERRLQQRASQRDLAILTGIDQGDISRLEGGRDALWSTYLRLARALDGELVVRFRPRGKRPESDAG